MRLLLDHNVPVALRRFLAGHDVASAEERGWSSLANGALLLAAEEAGFDALVTSDRNIRYQQNLTHRRIALVVLSTNNWNTLRDHAAAILDAVAAATLGSYQEVSLPRPPLRRHPPP